VRRRERTGFFDSAVSASLLCHCRDAHPLCFAISFNLLFAARGTGNCARLLAASGMIDRAGFRVKNILEASSGILVRMPLFATCWPFLEPLFKHG